MQTVQTGNLNTRQSSSGGSGVAQPKPSSSGSFLDKVGSFLGSLTLDKLVSDTVGGMSSNLSLLAGLPANAVNNVKNWGAFANTAATAAMDGTLKNWFQRMASDPVGTGSSTLGWMGQGLNAMGAGFGSDTNASLSRFAQWAYQNPLDAALLLQGGAGMANRIMGSADNIGAGLASEHPYPNAVGQWSSLSPSEMPGTPYPWESRVSRMPQDPFAPGVKTFQGPRNYLTDLVDETGQGMLFDPSNYSPYRKYHYGM